MVRLLDWFKPIIEKGIDKVCPGQVGVVGWEVMKISKKWLRKLGNLFQGPIGGIFGQEEIIITDVGQTARVEVGITLQDAFLIGPVEVGEEQRIRTFASFFDYRLPPRNCGGIFIVSKQQVGDEVAVEVKVLARFETVHTLLHLAQQCVGDSIVGIAQPEILIKELEHVLPFKFWIDAVIWIEAAVSPWVSAGEE